MSFIPVLMVCILALTLLMWVAPEGFQDDEGFHYGRKDSE